MLGIKEVIAEFAPMAGRPRYDVAAQKIVERLEQPPEKPIGQFDIDGEANEGVRRLNEVFRYVAFIPTQMAALKNRPLDVKQQEIANMMIRTCLPKIVGVDEWAQDRRKFLKMMAEYEGIDYSEWDDDGWTNFAGVICSRQNGKSWTLAVVAGAIMLSCNTISIGCYATTSKQAGVIQNYVIQIFAGMGLRMNQRMADNLCWFEHSATSIATITSFGLNA